MLDVRYSAQFKKDFDRMKKRGFPMHELKYIIETLVQEKPYRKNLWRKSIATMP